MNAINTLIFKPVKTAKIIAQKEQSSEAAPSIPNPCDGVSLSGQAGEANNADSISNLLNELKNLRNGNQSDDVSNYRREK